MLKKSLIFSLIFVFCACSVNSNSSMFTSPIQKEQVLKLSSNYDALISEYRKKVVQKNKDEDRLKLANLYYEINDFNNAMYFLSPLISKAKNAEVFITKAKILNKMQNYKDALNTLDLAAILDSKNAEIYNLKGIILAKNKELDKAKEAFFKARKYYENDLKINTNLGILELIQGNYKEALSYLKPLYVRDYKDSVFLNSLIFALIKNNELDLAKKIAKEQNLVDDFNNIVDYVNNSKVNFNKDF